MAAIGVKAAFLGLTLAGFGTMWMAVIADVGSSLLVVANGLRSLRAPTRGARGPGLPAPRAANGRRS